MLRLAHRGDWRRAPENTLPALLAALKMPGCDGVEFDVRLAADGVPVLVHDETLSRVQGRPERVDEVGSRALEDAGIPSLADVLAALPHRAFLDVELKGRHDRAVVEVLAAGRGPGLVNAVVSSFEPDTLERVAGLVPTWPRWLNAIDREALARARAAELKVAAFTIRRRPTRARLERLGIIAACVEAMALDD